ncbi:MAG: hypothetical protein ACJ71T_11135 [Actinomycetales bacterium]
MVAAATAVAAIGVVMLAPSPRAVAAVTPPSAGTPPPIPAAAQAYNYAPASRFVSPMSAAATAGNVTNAAGGFSQVPGNVVRLQGQGSYVVYDFGKEVGGTIQLQLAEVSDANQQLGVAYSESGLYAGPISDRSNGGTADGSMNIPMHPDTPPVSTVPTSELRGGFRYVTLFMRANGTVSFNALRVYVTFAPVQTLNSYPNYFLSSDPLLNRIWYAGAYTVQTNTLNPNQGRVWPARNDGWDNSANIGDGSTILADGAKRDRAVWPGDLGISFPTAFVSTNDLLSMRNSLRTIYDHSRYTAEWINGVQWFEELPYAGPPLKMYGSDTYHMWALLATSTYIKYSDDSDFATSIWAHYQTSLGYVLARLDDSNLFSVGHGDDWETANAISGESLEASALAYGVLRGAAFVARTYANDPSAAATYDTKADAVRDAINRRLWDPVRKLYRANPDGATYPQDGNALALWFGIPRDNALGGQDTATSLRQMFNQYGAPSPEKADAMGTFPASMEVHGLFAAHADQSALELIRREWGYMLNSPNGTKSTFWEGFKTDGSFDYGGSYMSASHGWATGPTSALTFNVVGLQPDVHSQFAFQPHPGDLTSASGRLTLRGGLADASWTRDPVTGRFTARVSAYAGTSVSRIAVPKHGNANMWISINGTEVWRFGTALSGTGYRVSQDDDAIYISAESGVLPSGRYDVVAQPDAVWDTSYRLCSVEGGACTVVSPRVVAFGANGQWVYKWLSGSTPCSSATFGSDPAFGVAKKCYSAPGGSARFDEPETGPAGYTFCSFEYQTCPFTGTKMVAIGGNGSFSYRAVSNGTTCSSAALGRSASTGTRVDCYVANQDPGPDYHLCGVDGTWCWSGSRVWFGAYGNYTVTDTQPPPGGGNISPCNAATMGGDPLPGVNKRCYTYSGGSSG